MILRLNGAAGGDDPSRRGAKEIESNVLWLHTLLFRLASSARVAKMSVCDTTVMDTDIGLIVPGHQAIPGILMPPAQFWNLVPVNGLFIPAIAAVEGAPLSCVCAQVTVGQRARWHKNAE
mgnify:CR=1 FL=1